MNLSSVYRTVFIISIFLLLFLPIIYADVAIEWHHFGYYKSGSVSAYGTWKHNTGCHKDWIRVKITGMNPSDTDLLITIEQRDDQTGNLKYTLWEGYLKLGERTPKVYAKPLSNPDYSDYIWVKVTDTHGHSVSFTLYIEGRV